MGIRDQVLTTRGNRADPNQELGIMDQGFKHYGSQGLGVRGRELGTRDRTNDLEYRAHLGLRTMN